MQGVEENQDSHVAAWARPLESNTRASSCASRWAALPPAGDSPPDDLELADAVVAVAVSSKETVQQQIAAISGTTTLAELRPTVKNINAVLVPCTDVSDISWCALQYHSILSKMATSGGCGEFVKKKTELHDDALHTFAYDNLRRTAANDGEPLKSHRVETYRYGETTKTLQRRRALGSISVIVLQRACASAFIGNLCDKVDAVSGHAETLLERHKGGDETPFARCSATDPIWDEAIIDAIVDIEEPMLAAAQPDGDQLLPHKIPEAEIETNVESNTAACKVYQTDVEVATLFILPESELLVSF